MGYKVTDADRRAAKAIEAANERLAETNGSSSRLTAKGMAEIIAQEMAAERDVEEGVVKGLSIEGGSGMSDKRWRCPRCKGDKLEVSVLVSANLHQTLDKETNDFETSIGLAYGDHEWDGDSMMLCRLCGMSGKAKKFEFRRDSNGILERLDRVEAGRKGSRKAGGGGKGGRTKAVR